MTSLMGSDHSLTIGTCEIFDGLLLARQEVQYTTKPSLENILTANMQVEMVALPIAGQVESQDMEIHGNRSGTPSSKTHEQAEERIIKQITTDTTMSLNLTQENQ